MASPPPWGPATILGTGNAPSGVAVADIDADGDADVVVSHASADGLVTFSQGVGTTFTQGTAYAPGDSYNHLLLRDLDGDGTVDIAAGEPDGTLNVLSNDGTGSLTVLGTGAGASKAVVAIDSDLDGDLDLYGVTNATSGTGWKGLFQFGNDGSLATVSGLLMTGEVTVDHHDLAHGDFDRDGDNDLVYLSATVTRALFNNRGDATDSNGDWTTLLNLSHLNGARDIAVADLNGDSTLDIVVSSSGGSGDAVVWFAGDGAGGFGTLQTLATGASDVNELVVTDVDRDGAIDVVLARTGGLDVLFGNGGTTWTAQSVDQGSATDVVVHDLDGDGDRDLVALGGGDIHWFENQQVHASFAFSTAETAVITGVGTPKPGTMVDLDHDGDLDALGIDASSGTAFYAEDLTGSGTVWGPAVLFTAGINTPVSVLHADLDQDGDQDAVTTGYLSGTPHQWFANELRTGGALSTNAESITTQTTSSLPVLVDFDGDGDLDHVRGQASGDVKVDLNGGDGMSWSTCTPYNGSTVGFDAVAVGDLDGDGDHDIVAGLNGGIASGVRWLQHTPDAGCAGTYIEVPVTSIVLGQAVSDNDALALGDIDGDGDLDVVGNGDGTLRWYDNPGAPANVAGLWPDNSIGTSVGTETSLVDIDHDGDLDVLTAGGNEVVAFINSNWGITWTQVAVAVAGATGLSLADVNQDGVADSYYGATGRYSLRLSTLQQAETTTIDATTTLSVPSSPSNISGAIEETTGDVVLSIAVDHTFGRSGDLDIELGPLSLFLHDGTGIPLSDSDAATILDSVEVYRDDGDGALGAADVLVASASSFALTSGELVLTPTGGLAGGSAPFGAVTDYLVVANVGAGATAGGFNEFGIDHLPSDGTLLLHTDTTVPVTLDGSPAGVSGVSVTIAPLDSDDDGDPDTTDCNDLDAAIYTGAPEVCDGVDEDCDGAIDDGFDADGDGSFDGAVALCVSTYGAAAVDCDDAVPAVNPSATEICDGIDNDCDAVVDEGFNVDGDAYTACGVDGVSGNSDDDCDDSDPTVYPGATEACDFLDSNCDGDLVDTFVNSDTDPLPDCIDTDDDDDGAPDGGAPGVADCADTDPTIYPGAPELCDAIDSDCNGSLVDGFTNTDGDLHPDCVDTDDDGDGMPDVWEFSQSPAFDPLDPSDASEDPDADGRSNVQEYDGATDPYVSEAPGAPTPLTPGDGVYLPTVTPTLEVSNATSPVGDALTYSVYVYEDEGGSTLLWSESEIEEGPTSTQFVVGDPLLEDARYWWQTTASDPYIEGPPSQLVSFVVDTAGTAPGAPTAVEPLRGRVLLVGPFSVTWEDADSPDGLPLDYTVEILDSLGALLGGGTTNGDASTPDESWTVDTALTPGAFYQWRVQAFDPSGRVGPFSESQYFGYGTSNAPPTTPNFLSPTNGDVITNASPEVRVSEGVDPEGGIVTYVLALASSPDFAPATEIELTVGGVGATFDLAAENLILSPGETWFARIHARDINGVESGTSTISFSREAEGDDDDSTEPADDDDSAPIDTDVEPPGFVIACSQGGPAGGSLLVLVLGMGLLVRRRRRSAGFLAPLVVLSLLLCPLPAHANSAGEIAVRAHTFHQEYCAEVAAGKTTSSLEAMREVVPVLTKLSQVYDTTGASYLLYWRALLLQCTGQEERALEDHRGFLANEKNEGNFPTLWTDAQRRVRQLEQAAGTAVIEKPRFSLGVGGAFELLASSDGAHPYGGFALDATVLSPFPIGGAFLVRLAAGGLAKTAQGEVATPERRSLLPVLGGAAVVRFGSAVRPRFQLGVQVGLGNANSHELAILPGVIAGAGVEFALGDAPVALRPSIEFGNLGRFFEARGLVQLVVGQ